MVSNRHTRREHRQTLYRRLFPRHPYGSVQIPKGCDCSVLQEQWHKVEAVLSEKRHSSEWPIYSTKIVFFVICTMQGTLAYCQERAVSPITSMALTRVECDQEGRLFVALGHTVIAIPDRPGATQFIPSLEDDQNSSKQRLQAPDNSQKAGCYANPIQTTVLFGMESTFVPSDLSIVNSDEILQVKKLDITRVFYWENSQNYEHDRLCNSNAKALTSENGIQVCIGNKGEFSLGRSHLPAPYMSYKIPEKVFQTYTGHGLSFSCGYGANLGGLRQCHTSLTINNDIALMLSFNPPEKGYDISFPQQVISLIGRIRSAISQAIVKNYTWK